ncbi:MAG: hypothetical protein FWD23_15810 [Oscillospiraceae bacterium]|nr:hypothetical protein [Oscillospiraceae bacterium]
MFTKKFIAVFLLFAVVIQFFACGGEPSTAQNGENAPDPNIGEQSETEKGGGHLPDINFNGADFHILMREEYEREFNAESENGDVVNDAVYKRSRTIEERFGINIKPVAVTGNFTQRQIFIDTLRNSVLAGDGAHDMVAGAANYLMALTGDGLFLNLLGSEYIDFEKPWWSSDFAKNMEINGVLYAATGDIAFNTLEDMIVMFFNKQMCTDYGIELPYQMVKEGKWTFDKLEELAKTVSADVDGNGKFDAADKYGYMLEGNTVKTIMLNMGVNFSGRGADGLPEMTYMSDRMIDIFDRMKSLLADREHIFKYPSTGDTLVVFGQMQQIFSEARMLFMSLVLSTAHSLRSMEVDFGLIPMPKYDEAQEKYRTVVLEKFSIVGIPASVRDPKMSEIILEGLALESTATTIPAYYDISLKVKQSRDTESGEMLDLIRSNVIYDFAYVNGQSLSDLSNFFNNVMTENGDIVSAYEKRNDLIEKNLNDLIAVYTK